jgi:tRNA nucleotidyltransferase (CCA-adding enzyme)
MLVSGRVGGSVRDYLALHKQRFAVRGSDDVGLGQVQRMIVVDVRRESRLRAYASVLERAHAGEVEVLVYDHHASTTQDVTAPRMFAVVEPVGAATTLLVERLRERALAIDAQEATLMAMGILEDTGRLTYARTTARDADAYAWCLARGARLAVIRRYLDAPFSSDQLELFTRMLGAAVGVRVGSATVATLVVELARPLSDLGALVGELARLEGHDAVLAVFPTAGKRSFVVGRSHVPGIDVELALRAVGGGGHAGAAAALVHDADGPAILDTMLAALSRPAPALTVADVMSRPVLTVDVTASLAEAWALLMQADVHGVAVLRDGTLAGILSHRDLERAHRDGRLHLPVASCMAHSPRTIGADASLEQALALMCEADVGRLPVVAGTRLLGIVTRADLLAWLYGEPLGRGTGAV